MTDQDWQRELREKDAKCLRQELGLEITLDSYPDLFSKMDSLAEIYIAAKKGEVIGMGRDLLEKYDRATIALQEARNLSNSLPELHLSETMKKFRKGKEVDVELEYMRNLGKASSRINDLIREVEKERGRAQEALLTFAPSGRLGLKHANGYLTWALCSLLERTFPKVYKFKIGKAVSCILHSWGVDAIKRSADAIRNRANRFKKSFHSQQRS
ncbi:hypothetical protein MYX64_04375 [Nitrospinae bacterium AH_259_B05_G02_I21]|nr:hypothetical protein [Nitrospinae bacterium AH_259_B05_G02_I21]